MKICPLCKVKFEDDADFCPVCKAQLDDLKVVEKAEKGKIPKSFWVSILAVFAFIVFMILLYSFFYSKIHG
ncbi:MAG TPA: hypothetical protein DEB31_04700 [Clostridiales bacterium]|nr:hypothetical protein [Clostridiales bacterium]